MCPASQTAAEQRLLAQGQATAGIPLKLWPYSCMQWISLWHLQLAPLLPSPSLCPDGYIACATMCLPFGWKINYISFISKGRESPLWHTLDNCVCISFLRTLMWMEGGLMVFISRVWMCLLFRRLKWCFKLSDYSLKYCFKDLFVSNSRTVEIIALSFAEETVSKYIHHLWP